MAESEKAESGDFFPFVGSLYSRANWQKFSTQFEIVKKKLASKHQEGIKTLTWLAPSNGLWGRNNYFPSCFASLVDGAITNGKNPVTLYRPTLFVPMDSAHDRQSCRRWKDDLAINLNYVNGYTQGFCDGAVEVVLLENELVAVTYYVSLPAIYPVPIPVGFISNNQKLIKRVAVELNQYLTGSSAGLNIHDLGVITKL